MLTTPDFLDLQVKHNICNGCNMGMRDLSDTYDQKPEGIHIRHITNGHVTSIMYQFVPIVTTPVVLIPQVIVTLVHKVISTNG